LWLVQNVDTTQAHIYHICNVPNLYRIKFLENLLAGFRGSGISGVCPESLDFPDILDLARRLRVVKVYIPLTAVKNSLSPLSQFHRALSLPRRLPLPLTQVLGDFHLPTGQIE
jgi:hypothetical protein